MNKREQKQLATDVTGTIMELLDALRNDERFRQLESSDQFTIQQAMQAFKGVYIHAARKGKVKYSDGN